MRRISFVVLALVVAGVCLGAEETARTIPHGQRWELFRDVTPNGRFALSFRAASEGPDTVERNAQLAEAFYDKRREMCGLNLPGWEIAFQDEKGEFVRYASSLFHRVVISSREESFKDVFFTPPRAARMRIRFTNNTADMTLRVSDLSVAPYEEKTVNINADFALGERNFSGYSPTYAGTPRIRRTADGFVMELENYAFADMTPVTGGKTYRLEVAMVRKVRRNPNVRLSFFDAEGKGVIDSGGLLWITEPDKNFSMDLKAPAKATSLSLALNGNPGVAFKYVRVTEVK